MSSVALLPLGAPPEAVVARMGAGLHEAFGLHTTRMPACPDPPDAFEASRDQWDATDVLRSLLGVAPGRRLLAVTERDLFIPVLSFVYGQAQLCGRVAVVSLARLRPEFHGLRPDPEQLARRAVTEGVHEVGHTLGLVHCSDRRCPMALSLGLEDLDFKTATPCASCAALLRESKSAPEQGAAARIGGTP